MISINFSNNLKKRSEQPFFLLLIIALLCFAPTSFAFQKNLISVANSSFDLQFADQGISSLKRANDVYDTDYILEGRQLGNVLIRFRRPGSRWVTLSTRDMAQKGKLKKSVVSKDKIYFTVAQKEGLVLTMKFTLKDDNLLWNIGLKNENNFPVEIGDVAIPFPMNHDWSWESDITYNKRVIRHSMISGNNSFLFWMRCNTIGPYLLMTPRGDTHLEYYDQSTKNKDGRSIYTAYIHSLAQKEVIDQQDGNWRQPHTSVMLQPTGHEKDAWKAGFTFHWEAGYDEIQQTLYDEGLFNIHTTPGMTVPRELPVKVALKNKLPIHKIEAEFPDRTSVRSIKETNNGFHIYEIKFDKLGENKLTINYGDQRTFYLEYFITESIATLIRKRAQFLVNREQIRGAGKWYDGVFSDWSMKDEWLLSPEEIRDIPEARRYMVSSDDPALSRPSFLAKKNVSYPVQEEVEALDYYIGNFVWGGLQMTKEEIYPYAIYGIHDWKMNRESDDFGQYGKTHIWRIYDYPHIVQMYISMYRVARYHTGIDTELTAEEYLERAYGTAVAFFTIPEEVIGWSPYHTGNYNELAILDVIEELEKAGNPMRANRLRQHWEKKVANFVNGEVNLFGSEYSYDTTGFESTGAFARYAIAVANRLEKENDMLPLNISQEEAVEFMKKQVAVNVGTRGWLEKAYYLYGSDYRGSGNTKYLLSYMAQMGGWALLDYTLYFAENPRQYLRLAYGSVLSSWALMNTGTKRSNYGYWYPGKINDGGAGGGFEPMAYAKNWLELLQSRGSWYYGCEIDLGFTGYLRASSTILADDPIFGMTAFGGILKEQEDTFQIIPKDGIRRRFHFIQDDSKIHISLNYVRFEANAFITISRSLENISFSLENDNEEPYNIELQLEGLPEGKYSINIDNKTITTLDSNGSNKIIVQVPVNPATHKVKISRVS